MKRSITIDPNFQELQKISGLIIKKSWSRGKCPIFLVLQKNYPLPTELQGVKFSDSDPTSSLLALNFLVDNLEKLSNPEDLDLDFVLRFQMKEIACKIFQVESTDQIRLVQAGLKIFIFVEKSVKNFQKTDNSYKWSWNYC